MSFESLSSLVKNFGINEYSNERDFQEDVILDLEQQLIDFDHRKHQLKAKWKELIDMGIISLLVSDENRTYWAFRKALRALRFDTSQHSDNIDPEVKLLIQYYIAIANLRFRKKKWYDDLQEYVDECDKLYRIMTTIRIDSKILKSGILCLRAIIGSSKHAIEDVDGLFEKSFDLIEETQYSEFKINLLLEWISFRLKIEQSRSWPYKRPTLNLIEKVYSISDTKSLKEYCRLLTLKSCKTNSSFDNLLNSEFYNQPVIHNKIIELSTINRSLLTLNQSKEFDKFLVENNLND